MAEEVREIAQDKGNGNCLSAMLIKERELRIEDKGIRKTLKFCIDIVALKGESKRKITLGWQWIVAGLVCLLVSFVIPMMFSSFFVESLTRYLVYLLGVVIAMGCFYMAWKTTSVKQIFYSRNAEVPLIELHAGKPSKDEISTFVAKVEECIRAVQQKMNLSHKRQLAGEMKMLRRLSEEGVISASEYKKAQAILLSLH